MSFKEILFPEKIIFGRYLEVYKNFLEGIWSPRDRFQALGSLHVYHHEKAEGFSHRCFERGVRLVALKWFVLEGVEWFLCLHAYVAIHKNSYLIFTNVTKGYMHLSSDVVLYGIYSHGRGAPEEKNS